MVHRPWLPLIIMALVALPAQAQDASPEAKAEPALPAGTIYYWYDGSGQLHATDQLDQVPEGQRGEARDRAGALPDGQGTQLNGGGNNGGAAYSGSRRGSAFKADDKKDKAYWQGRLAEAESRVAEAKARLKEVDAELLRVRSTRPPGFHETLAELAKEREALQKTIEAGEEALKSGIPEEARKAGAPPGWLR